MTGGCLGSVLLGVEMGGCGIGTESVDEEDKEYVVWLLKVPGWLVCSLLSVLRKTMFLMSISASGGDGDGDDITHAEHLHLLCPVAGSILLPPYSRCHCGNIFCRFSLFLEKLESSVGALGRVWIGGVVGEMLV